MSKQRIPVGDDFLSPAELASLTPAELVRRTSKLAPFIRDHAAQAEQLRRPVAAVWSAIRRSGFFYQFVPQARGGMGVDTDTFIDAALPIAMADPATAWSACFCAGHNRTFAHFPKEAQQEIWRGAPYITAPSLGVPPGKATRVKDGYRISGTWSWASGIMDADWVLAVTILGEGSESKMAMAIFPAKDASVIDTWNMDGLAASGSNDVTVTDVFIPEYRMMFDKGLFNGTSVGARDYPEAVFHMPLITFAGFVASVPVLGAAKGLLAIWRQILPTRVAKGTQTALGENPAAQVRLARAELMVSTAEHVIRKVGRSGMEVGHLEEHEQVTTRIRLRAETAFAVKLCRDAAALLSEGAGSSVHRLEQPFQRLLRDLNIMSSHVGFDQDACNELHGRAILGLQPNSFIF